MKDLVARTLSSQPKAQGGMFAFGFKRKVIPKKKASQDGLTTSSSSSYKSQMKSLTSSDASDSISSAKAS
eukprot:5264121-Ditylum_brightwellii.AAC.1